MVRKSALRKLVGKAVRKPLTSMTNQGPSIKQRGNFGPLGATKHPAISMYLKAKKHPDKIKRGGNWRKVTAKAIRDLRNK